MINRRVTLLIYSSHDGNRSYTYCDYNCHRHLPSQNRRRPYTRRQLGQENTSRILDSYRLTHHLVYPTREYACKFHIQQRNTHLVQTALRCRNYTSAMWVYLWLVEVSSSSLVCCLPFLLPTTASNMMGPLVGTVIGEIITFYMFRSCLRARAEKIERGKESPRWAALARVIREGGFTTAFIVRYSAVPTHSKSSVPLKTTSRH